MYDEQPDLFDVLKADMDKYVDTRSELEKENERLKDLLTSYVCGGDESVATEKFLLLVVKRMGRYLSESNRKRIILGAFYTLYRETDEVTFDNVLNPIIHELDLRCYEWDDYLAKRLSSRKRR